MATMVANRIEELRKEVRDILRPIQPIVKAAEDEARDLTADEQGRVKEAFDKVTKLKARIGKLEAGETPDDNADLAAAMKDIGLELGIEHNPNPRNHGKATSYDQPRRKTIGAAFTESPQWKAFWEQFPGGNIPEKTRVQSLPVGFKTLLTGTSSTSAGALVNPDIDNEIEPLGRRPLEIRNLISNRQTGSDTVQYVRQTSRVNAAAPVAEAGATGDGSGLKPEGGFALEVVTETVKTIAEWIPATKRALADVAQLRGLIDDELRDDLEEELEDQIVNGDGVGENFLGVLNTPNTQAQAWDTDILTTTRKAKTKVRTVGRSMATAYVLNPEDWERIDLLQDNEARYYFGGPMVEGTPRLWGLPVIESEAMPAGTGVVADWRKAILWDREEANITVSDSHSDFFVRNLVAILAEMRAAFGVRRPTAFVEIDLTA